MCRAGIVAAHARSSVPRRKLRITPRAQRMPSTRKSPPCEVTWTVLRSVTISTFSPSLGPMTGASSSGVSESRSPPTISTGTDAGSLTDGSRGGRLNGFGQSRQTS